MTNQIAIIDPFVNSPAVSCFNGLVSLLGLKASYHLPSPLGIQSLLDGTSENRAYIVLGSASHIHQNLSWHKPLADFLVRELKKNKPVLGCCFGHQLICHAFGAEVEYLTTEETKILGTRKITITEDTHDFKRGESFLLGVSHKQIVRHLPAELKEIGLGLENDIVVHRNLPFMGTQSHPEASYHFCQNDIGNLQDSEITTIQADGGELIRRFFRFHKLI